MFGTTIPSTVGSAESSAPPQGQLAPRPIEPPTSGCLAPEYPPQARRLGVTGITRVVFTVGSSGIPKYIVVAQHSGLSQGHQWLDDAAVAAIAKCNFGEVNGYKAVRVAQDFFWQLSAPPIQVPDSQGGSQ